MRSVLSLSVVLTGLLLFLREAAAFFGLALWSVRPSLAGCVVVAVFFLFSFVFVSGLKQKKGALALNGAVCLIVGAVASLWFEGLFSPIKPLTEKDREPLQLTTTGAIQVLKHPSLGFSLVLPDNVFALPSPAGAGGVLEYSLLTPSESRFHGVKVLFFRASLTHGEQERYAKRMLANATIQDQKSTWDDAQREVKLSASQNGVYLKLRVLQVKLGAEKDDYVLCLMGTAPDAEDAAKAVERLVVGPQN